MNQVENHEELTNNDNSQLLSEERLKRLIKELGLHPQNGEDGIGDELENYYKEKDAMERKIKEKYFEVKEDLFEEESINDSLKKKNPKKHTTHWKYSVGRFKFN